MSASWWQLFSKPAALSLYLIGPGLTAPCMSACRLWLNISLARSRLPMGLAQRMAADPSFLFKLGVECSLDAAIILAVNLTTRRDKFLSQLEFVGCQVGHAPFCLCCCMHGLNSALLISTLAAGMCFLSLDRQVCKALLAANALRFPCC